MKEKSSDEKDYMDGIDEPVVCAVWDFSALACFRASGAVYTGRTFCTDQAD